MRIYKHLQNKQIPFDWIQHAPAFSSQKLAKTLRVPGKFVAKSVLLQSKSNFFIAILPADSMLDRVFIEKHLNLKIQFANSLDISELFFDCEWGVVPAIGSAYQIQTIADASLLNSAFLIVAGHSHMESVKIRLDDFLSLENPAIFDFARNSMATAS